MMGMVMMMVLLSVAVVSQMLLVIGGRVSGSIIGRNHWMVPCRTGCTVVSRGRAAALLRRIVYRLLLPSNELINLLLLLVLLRHVMVCMRLEG